jgi:inner membrane transporter RhtA
MAEKQQEWAGAALMFGGALSNQTGAAVGALAFPVIGPVGVVAVRQCVAAAVLLAVGRPRWRSYGWGQWWPVLLLAAVFAMMNLSLYSAIDRIGLGLAATLEFLGPLAVSLAASRRRADLLPAVLAVAGVLVLTHPRPSTDYAGIGLALLAALCWAAYIQLNRLIGRRLPGAEGSATAAALSALAFLPVAAGLLTDRQVPAWALGCAVATGVLSSAVPFLADLFALRRVAPRVFGICMSAHPALGAAVGWAVLGQSLGWDAWLGIGAVVTASALTVRGARPRRTPPTAPLPVRPRPPRAPARRRG